MEKTLTDSIKKYATLFNMEFAMLAAFVATETGGSAFDKTTGKIIIQFEPSWFKRQAKRRGRPAPNGLWEYNGVEVQSKEWAAFNDAFSKDATAAMESTSIGLGQILGVHWAALGYNSVGEMWDAAKEGIDTQVYQICLFIKATKGLHTAMKTKNFHTIASLYNGANFEKLAIKLGREPYDVTLAKFYKKFSV